MQHGKFMTSHYAECLVSGRNMSTLKWVQAPFCPQLITGMSVEILIF